MPHVLLRSDSSHQGCNILRELATLRLQQGEFPYASQADRIQMEQWLEKFILQADNFFSVCDGLSPSVWETNVL